MFRIRIPTTVSFGSIGFERTGIVLSFLIPALIRWIPEMQFPYPIGFDTPLYISWGRHFASNPTIFPLMLPLLGMLYALGLDLIAVMKYLPTILYGLLGFSTYRFSHSYLSWSARKSLLSVFLVALSFASLRASWDMHKQLMGMAFLLLALSYLKTLEKPSSLVAFSLFSFLAAFSHELVLAILIMVLVFWVLFVAKKELKKILPPIGVMSGVVFLLLSVWWGWRLEGILIRTFPPQLSYSSSLASSLLWESSTNVSLFLQLYGLMLLLIVLGLFKDGALLPWLCLVLLGSFFTIVFPFHIFGVLPWRWMLLATYPFAFYVANGFDRFHFLKRSIFKFTSFALILFAINASTWGFLGLVRQAPPFCRSNVFPETMASSSIPLHDIEATVWLTKKFDAIEGSVLIVHGHYFGWVSYFTEKKVVTFGELYGRDRTIKQTVELVHGEYAGDIYLLWYLDSDAHLSGFAKVAENGTMKLYKYIET